MPISYIYTGNPLTGTSGDDFFIAYAGSTGTSDNTVNGGDGDDLVIGDASNTFIPSATTQNQSIATAMALDSASIWTTDENPMFGISTIPHTTAIVETTVGQAEYFSVTVGAGETITIDLDFGDNSPIGVPNDHVMELLDGAGNIIASDSGGIVTEGGLGSFANSASGNETYDPLLTYTSPTSTTYYIRIRPFGNQTYTASETFVLNISVSGHAVGTNSVMGVDIINGDAGDDSLYGQGGNDIINGGTGDDIIHGGTGADTLFGGADNDIIYGGGEGVNDQVFGEAGNDILYSQGEGSYFGGDGDDLIHAGLTSGTQEIMDGGAGIDTLDTRTWSGAYAIDLAAGTTNFGETVANFEHLISGDGADTVTGSAFGNTIRTNGGNDLVDGGDGDDILEGGAGVDTLNGGNGSDTLRGGEGADTLNGGAGGDTASYNESLAGVTVDLAAGTGAGGDAAGDTLTLIENVVGSLYADTLTGGSASNWLSGLNSDDVLNGGGGDDTLLGGSGADTLNGGTGNDTADYSTSPFAVTVNLGTGAVSGGDAVGDVLNSIEWVIGSAFGDTLTGSAASNFLDGGGGDDTLTGGAGMDVLYGGSGVDTVRYADATSGVKIYLNTGTAGAWAAGDVFNSIENIIGSSFDDILVGTNAANFIQGGGGADEIKGGLGHDQLLGAVGDDVLEGGDGDDTLAGGDNRDTLQGDAGSDTLNGGSGVDKLYAGAGEDDVIGGADNDKLFGGSDDDMLDGGQGNDILTGGSGNDWFNFTNASGADVITDFRAGAGLRDVIAFSTGLFADFADVRAHTTNDGLGNCIIAKGGISVLLEGVIRADLVADDFDFLLPAPVLEPVVKGGEALTLPDALDPLDPLVLPTGLDGKAAAEEAPVVCLPGSEAAVQAFAQDIDIRGLLREEVRDFAWVF